MIVKLGIRNELRWFYEARFGMFVPFKRSRIDLIGERVVTRAARSATTQGDPRARQT
jgi:hypothetical protein